MVLILSMGFRNLGEMASVLAHLRWTNCRKFETMWDCTKVGSVKAYQVIYKWLLLAWRADQFFTHRLWSIQFDTNPFDLLGDRILSGTIVVFDKYFNFNGWGKCEFGALQEFVEKHHVECEYITYDTNHEQVAVIIKGTRIWWVNNLRIAIRPPDKYSFEVIVILQVS